MKNLNTHKADETLQGELGLIIRFTAVCCLCRSHCNSMTEDTDGLCRWDAGKRTSCQTLNRSRSSACAASFKPWSCSKTKQMEMCWGRCALTLSCSTVCVVSSLTHFCTEASPLCSSPASPLKSKADIFALFPATTFLYVYYANNFFVCLLLFHFVFFSFAFVWVFF